MSAIFGYDFFVQNRPRKDKSQRMAGVTLTVITAALILSGYLLYYLGIEWLRDWTSLIHWVVGLALPAFFVWHYLGRSAAKSKGRAKSIDL